MRKPLHILSAAILLATVGMGAANASSYQFKLPLKGIAPPANWQPHEPLYGEWEDVGDVFGCSNWAPAPLTVAVDQPFTQTATDCKQDQARTVQPRERDTRSGAIRNAGEPFTETRTLTASATRDAVGTKETWSAAEAIYSAWTNSGSVYNCSAWSPDASTVTAGTTFTQTRSCSQNQTRTRQDREYEPTLGQYRNVGAPVTETQTISVPQSQQATGTKPVGPVCRYEGPTGGVYGLPRTAVTVRIDNTSGQYMHQYRLDGVLIGDFSQYTSQLSYGGKTYTAGAQTNQAVIGPQGAVRVSYSEICYQ